MDRKTIELVHLGIHPDQLALPEHYHYKYSIAKQVRILYLAAKKQETPVPHPPLRRVGTLPPPNHYNRGFDTTCCIDYHFFLFDRIDLRDCKNPTCQQHMRCGMAEMPKRRNKAWQILSSGGFKSSIHG
ncbi:hypothetical protein LTS07_010450 [Exophiala sideris]|uniref:Uncharacterized protein n=1 Tax=Exophiala sideris TaxID=1016849 RepID=A0ABR0IX34_9EURO|nr:hypothetical protein LTS07_010450 [Exophiala sideris]KAK5026297.1 hypothetical protein LTR13_010078 [Exophiala sideris]KAK5051087.1 hypothetical protein LTR69_010463 [Exophiala sideris]KAK5177269.1 hypothetical protein LTR44_010231 [Eurotiomycetes sp. CCFEE 6388]